MTDGPIKETTGVLAVLARDIYQDLVHPAAGRIGIAVETLAKIALTPVSLLDWGFDKSKDWLKEKIEQRLKTIPADQVVAPSPSIAIPAITHIAMASDQPGHREIYAELLLKAIDARTKDMVHPSYVHVVEQLSPEEALLVTSLHGLSREELFVGKGNSWGSKGATIEEQLHEHCKTIGLQNPERAEFWLDNLQRLRILNLTTYIEPVLKPEENHHRHGHTAASVETIEHHQLLFTTFGLAFVAACALPNQ